MLHPPRVSGRLRRAKSSTSGPSCYHSLERSESSGVTIAHLQALAAAEIAFDNAQALGRSNSSRTSEPPPSEQLLRRSQSVRYTGPNAKPVLKKTITRRQVRGWDEVRFDNFPKTPKSNAENSHTAALQNLEHPGQPDPDVPLSQLGLTHASDQRDKAFHPPLRESSNMVRCRAWGDIELTDTSSKVLMKAQQRDIPVSPPVVCPPRFSRHLYSSDSLFHDKVLAQARYEYLSQLQWRDAEGVETATFSRPSSTRKPFAKTVRSRGISSYGNPIASQVQNTSSKYHSSSVKLKMKKLKGKVWAIFHKSEGPEIPAVPNQHVTANRPHYELEPKKDTTAGGEYTLVPAPDNASVLSLYQRDNEPFPTPKQTYQTDSKKPVQRVRSTRSTGSLRSTSSGFRKASATSTWEQGSVDVKPSYELPQLKDTNKRLTTIKEDQVYRKGSAIEGGISPLEHELSPFETPLNFEVDTRHLAHQLHKRTQECLVSNGDTNDTMWYMRGKEIPNPPKTDERHCLLPPKPELPAYLRSASSSQRLHRSYQDANASSQSSHASTVQRYRDRIDNNGEFSRICYGYYGHFRDPRAEQAEMARIRSMSDLSEDSGSVYSRDIDGSQFRNNNSAEFVGSRQNIRPLNLPFHTASAYPPTLESSTGSSTDLLCQNTTRMGFHEHRASPTASTVNFTLPRTRGHQRRAVNVLGGSRDFEPYIERDRDAGDNAAMVHRNHSSGSTWYQPYVEDYKEPLPASLWSNPGVNEYEQPLPATDKQGSQPHSYRHGSNQNESRLHIFQSTHPTSEWMADPGSGPHYDAAATQFFQKMTRSQAASSHGVSHTNSRFDRHFDATPTSFQDTGSINMVKTAPNLDRHVNAAAAPFQNTADVPRPSALHSSHCHVEEAVSQSPNASYATRQTVDSDTNTHITMAAYPPRNTSLPSRSSATPSSDRNLHAQFHDLYDYYRAKLREQQRNHNSGADQNQADHRADPQQPQSLDTCSSSQLRSADPLRYPMIEQGKSPISTTSSPQDRCIPCMPTLDYTSDSELGPKRGMDGGVENQNPNSRQAVAKNASKPTVRFQEKIKSGPALDNDHSSRHQDPRQHHQVASEKTLAAPNVRLPVDSKVNNGSANTGSSNTQHTTSYYPDLSDHFSARHPALRANTPSAPNMRSQTNVAHSASSSSGYGYDTGTQDAGLQSPAVLAPSMTRQPHIQARVGNYINLPLPAPQAFGRRSSSLSAPTPPSAASRARINTPFTANIVHQNNSSNQGAQSHYFSQSGNERPHRVAFVPSVQGEMPQAGMRLGREYHGHTSGDAGYGNVGYGQGR